MFRQPIGSGIELLFPDGHTEEHLFDSEAAEVEVSSLARGSYSAKIIGAGGSAPPTPIHLSQDQDVELLMLSYLDMAVVFGIPLGLAILFLLIGHSHLFDGLWRRTSRLKELAYQFVRRKAPLKP